MSDPRQRGRPPGRPLDRTALAAAYDQYHLAIYRYLYRQVGDPETARDLAADVFRRLLTAVKQGHGPAENLKAWLYRTAHNLVIDHYRRQKHRAHLPLPDDIVDAGDNPVLAAEFRLSAEQVKLTLQRLTPDQRQVIVLKYLEGLSNTEVSNIIDKPVGAIKSLQHRALEALRRELARYEEKVPL